MAADVQNLMMGLGIALQSYNIMVAIIGLILGIIVGVLPGLGGANGVAILIPVVVTMPATTGVILLASIYWGALYGGSITSILFNIPGEPWSVATTFDGYPMAKAGKAGKALVISFLAHGVGALVGIVMLTFFAPIIAEFALKFGPAEIFAVMMLPSQNRCGHSVRFYPCGNWNGYCERTTSHDVWVSRPHGRFQFYRGCHRALWTG
jgi:putative tricarboxylic transport membrane protein